MSTTLWRPDEGIARLIASSATFQATVGATDVPTAIQHVHHAGDADQKFACARAVVDMEGSMSRESKGIGEWKMDGSIAVTIEKMVEKPDVVDTDAYRQTKETFMTWISQVMKDVENVYDSQVTLDGNNQVGIAGYSLADGPWPVPESEMPSIDETDQDISDDYKNKMRWWCVFNFDIY